MIHRPRLEKKAGCKGMEEAQSKLYTLRKRKNKLVRVWRDVKQAVYPQEEKK